MLLCREGSRAYAELEKHVQPIKDIEIKTVNCSFEEAIPEAVQFIHADNKTFSFVFIDPTGWTGFGMDAIAPLLRLKPSEVEIGVQSGPTSGV